MWSNNNNGRFELVKSVVKEASALVEPEPPGSLYDELNNMFLHNMAHHCILNSVILEERGTGKKFAVASAHVSWKNMKY